MLTMEELYYVWKYGGYSHDGEDPTIPIGRGMTLELIPPEERKRHTRFSRKFS